MKQFKLLLVACLVFTLVACAGGNVATNNVTPTESKVAESVEAKEQNTKVNYPRVDGSTANIPMMAQIRSSYLGEDLVESQNNSLEVTTTDYAWRNLIDGKNDLLLVYEPSEETKKIIDESPVKLKVTPIGVDALVFIVNQKNKVKNLTTEQIRDIYSGKITNWKELGGDDAVIEAYQRVLNSGSQTLFLNLVMKDVKPVDAPIKYRIEGMDGLIETLASYNNTGNALGYSVFYYAKKCMQFLDLNLYQLMVLCQAMKLLEMLNIHF